MTVLSAATDRAARRPCPACGAREAGEVVFEERIDPARVGSMTFSSRKTPEFFSFQLERCPTCSVLYAPRIPPEAWLLQAYRDAGYDSAEEAHLAAETYATALAPLWGRWNVRGPALEIGSGSGSFLTWLRQAGFDPVIGIEPSIAAAQAAPPAIRPLIRIDTFDAGQYPRESFAFVCSFQTFEHLAHPDKVLAGMHDVLQPNGRVAIVVHDSTAWINRLLGRGSPIIDIEHLQLFSPASLDFLARRAGFRVEKVDVLRNRYPLAYWVKLTPAPRALKRVAASILRWSGLGALRLSFNVGNLLAVLEKHEPTGKVHE